VYPHTHCVVGTILSDVHLRADHVHWMINAARHGVTDEAIAALYQDSPPRRGSLSRAPVCPPGRFTTILETLRHVYTPVDARPVARRMQKHRAQPTGFPLLPREGVAVWLAFRTAAAMLHICENLAEHDRDWWRAEADWTPVPVDVPAAHLVWIAAFLEPMPHASYVRSTGRAHARDTRVRGAPIPSDILDARQMTIAAASRMRRGAMSVPRPEPRQLCGRHEHPRLVGHTTVPRPARGDGVLLCDRTRSRFAHPGRGRSPERGPSR
jgi:hypothetical protein